MSWSCSPSSRSHEPELSTSCSSELSRAVPLELSCTKCCTDLKLQKNSKLTQISQTQSPRHNTNCEVERLHYMTQLLRAMKNSPLLFPEGKLKYTSLLLSLKPVILYHLRFQLVDDVRVAFLSQFCALCLKALKTYDD